MSTKQWTEKQTKEIMKKVIRRAEVSRIALLLQHRLALATIKQQNGWENLTLDAIEPKLEEDLKRKRSRIITSPLSTFSNQGQSGQQYQGQQTQHGRKRSRTDSTPPNSKRPRAAPITRPSTANPTTVVRGIRDLHEPQRPSTSHAPRISQSSPLQHGGYYSLSNKYGSGSTATFHSSPPRVEPRIPRTPPRRVTPRLALKPTGEEGADLLLYLATSPSPAVKKSGEGRFIPTTPPSRSSGAFNSIPQTPQTGFNFADFINITPSPAPGFERSGSAYRGTPVEKARRRINFDGLAPPRQSPGLQRAGSSLGSMGPMGGDLVRG
ncbi:hypothetical protein BZA77DRAFT_333260 [Pyronema omphalodes]|nr:hypothetical protein BZA77DRAFT_333260 [Pyronema omphalodes]